MAADPQALLDEGRFEEALACLESASGTQADFGRGVTLQLLGRFEEAQTAYENVLAIDPDHQETLANLVAMNIELFDLSRVERYSRRLLAVARDASIALRGLIVVEVERRNFEIAASFFSRLTSAEENCRDLVEYRLSWQTVERLKKHRA